MVQQSHFWIYIQRNEITVSKTRAYSHIYYSTIQNSEDMEKTKMSMDRWMDKENVIYVHTIEYYSDFKRRKKSWDLWPRGHYTKYNKPVREEQILYDIIYMQATDTRWWTKHISLIFFWRLIEIRGEKRLLMKTCVRSLNIFRYHWTEDLNEFQKI